MSNQPGLLKRVDQTGIPLLLARVIVGGMFVYMGANKIADPPQFLKMVRLYHMVPEHMPLLLNAMAALLPWVEVFCGLLLIAGIAIRGTALVMLAMLTVFSIAIFMRALDIYNAGGIPFCAIKFDCGCGTGEEYTCHKLPKNAGLWLLSLIALLSKSRKFTLWPNLVPANPIPWNIEGY